MGEVPMSCTECEICPEGAFQSPQEYIDLETELKDHPVLRPIPIPDGGLYGGIVEEFFYRCKNCGQEWHYAQSDFPFKGWWSKLVPNSSND